VKVQARSDIDEAIKLRWLSKSLISCGCLVECVDDTVDNLLDEG
jgi:hypothetical protein